MNKEKIISKFKDRNFVLIFIGIVFIIVYTLILINTTPKDFMGATWGMSVDEVKQMEYKNKTDVISIDNYCYDNCLYVDNIDVDYLNGSLEYDFNNKKLVKIVYKYMSDFDDVYLFKDDLITELNKKYWKGKKVNEDDLDYSIISDSPTGTYEYYLWETNRTTIILQYGKKDIDYSDFDLNDPSTYITTPYRINIYAVPSYELDEKINQNRKF